MTDSRVRRYAITSFDQDPPTYNPEIVNYLIYGSEICPKTGTPHWQIYAEFAQKQSMVQVLEKLHICKGWASACKGTAEQNIAYCTKEGKAIGEFGTPGQAGHRTDLDELWDDISEGYSAKDILRRRGGKALRYINMIVRARSIMLDTDEKERINNVVANSTKPDIPVYLPKSCPSQKCDVEIDNGPNLRNYDFVGADHRYWKQE